MDISTQICHTYQFINYTLEKNVNETGHQNGLEKTNSKGEKYI